MEQILAAIDFSEQTRGVVALAAKLAEALSCELSLLHVAAPDPDFVGYEVGPQHVRDARAQALRSEHQDLNRLAADLRQRGLAAKALLVQGPSVEKIVAMAERLSADLIVLGSHGRNALSRALLGSVSEGVLRHAPCPVLVVPRHSGDPPGAGDENRREG